MALAAVLDRARARVGFGARLARASWTALAAALVVELGAIADRGVPHAAEAALGVGAALAVVAVALLVLGRRPTRTEAARRLDGALAKGSLVETAAEALDGRHGPFSALLVKDAEEALSGSDVRRLVPIEPPRALGAGAGAALLLLAVALGPAAERPPEAPQPSPFEVELETGATPGAAPFAKRGPKKNVLAPTSGTPKNATKLDPEIAKRLERDLRALSTTLAARKDAPASPDEAKHAKDLEDALARGDEAALRAAMSALASAGTARSEKTVAKAADTLAGKTGGEERTAGGGAGKGVGDTGGTGAGSGGAGTASADPGKAAHEEDPWRVREAVSRYRASLE